MSSLIRISSSLLTLRSSYEVLRESELEELVSVKLNPIFLEKQNSSLPHSLVSNISSELLLMLRACLSDWLVLIVLYSLEDLFFGLEMITTLLFVVLSSKEFFLVFWINFLSWRRLSHSISLEYTPDSFRSIVKSSKFNDFSLNWIFTIS